MEFKYRAVDERPPKDIPPPSSTFNPLLPQGFLPHPVNLELEKVRLREAIIASEIARQRALEAQVRSELETGLPLDQRFTLHLHSRSTLPFMHHLNNYNRCPSESPFILFPPSLPPSPILLPSPLTQVLDNEVENTTEKKKLIMLVSTF